MKRLLLNCPNCGAPLRHDGFCEYCNTKIRYENEIDIFDAELLRGADIEILLKISKNSGTHYIPIEGHITSITQKNDELTFYADNAPVIIAYDPTYEITFEGHISKDKLIANQEESNAE